MYLMAIVRAKYKSIIIRFSRRTPRCAALSHLLDALSINSFVMYMTRLAAVIFANDESHDGADGLTDTRRSSRL